MKALLLAAGFGTRLRPLTYTVPKCLVPIAGKPLLEIWLDRLTEAGIGPFLINTHYLPGHVQDFVAKSPHRNQVQLVHEAQLIGTAGTLIRNVGFYSGEDGLLIHADNFCLADLRGFLRAHEKRPTNCLMTMMTFRTDTPSSCGIVQLDEQGRLIDFFEKEANPPGNLANGAVYALSAELIDWLVRQNANAKDFSMEILPQLKGRIYTWETSATFADIGTPESYARICALWRHAEDQPAASERRHLSRDQVLPPR